MNPISATALMATLALAGCATATTTPSSTLPPPPAPPSMPRVYFYPLQGQSAQRQDRDRYECFNWAVARTGFDPSRQPLPRETRATVVPASAPGTAVLAGAATGAMVGAAVSSPWNTGEGAAISAVAGGMFGVIAEGAQAAEAERIESQLNSSASNSSASRYEQQSGEFRRAMSACLEGRGYAVK